MKNKEIMEVIGDLDDRYVMEFAQVQPAARAGLTRWMLPVAASLCLLAGALGLYFMNGEEPLVSLEQSVPSTTLSAETTLPDTPSKTEQLVIWAGRRDAFDFFGDADFADEALSSVGEVVLLPVLQEAIARYSNCDVRFAVRLWDEVGAEDALVYEQVTRALDLDWDGGEILYLTEEQIRAIRCPEGMALIVGLVQKTVIHDITLDALDTLEKNTILAEVWFAFPDTFYQAYLQAYRNGQYESWEAMCDAKETEMIAGLEIYAAELGLSPEDIRYTQCLLTTASFTAELNKDQIRSLLTEAQFDNVYQISEVYGDIYCEVLYEDFAIG